MRALISACEEGFLGVAAGGREEAGSGMNKDEDSRLAGVVCWVLLMFVKRGSMTCSCSRGWEDFHS